MSLHTIVHSGLAGRFRLRRPAIAGPRDAADLVVQQPNGSMRYLETMLALTAIGTALLIGLGR